MIYISPGCVIADEIVIFITDIFPNLIQFFNIQIRSRIGRYSASFIVNPSATEAIISKITKEARASPHSG